ncbi:hypothetical protein Q4511_14810 [Paracoccus sp. 1_MG-2023]|uniref:hypothetical protein n=1 Tax=unclassified Paracoccus (in: a-proteobacteria) TaxID=2688777 RepID=UPI001C08CE35|nr:MULTISPECIES: hypothetical protein [unclassified Paracoccus (in: a-proteobacteria)]MBU2956811.1 hypothetical protein [Paracoccus sp. C2R09]MDO6670196.1 hypothetical protein [Paracoccus sp. 1_MG-2023]
MPEWITENIDLIQAGAALLSALVWIFYLQVIVSGLRRQRRSEILITLAGRMDLSASMMISNLGFEPIYVLDILVRSLSEEDEAVVSVVDRIDPDRDESSEKLTTLQSPLKTGEHVEAGRLDEMLRRASWWADLNSHPDKLHRIEVTVAAVTAATSSIVAARRIFHVSCEDGNIRIRPDGIYAEQIRDRRGRRRIEKQLNDMI